MDGSFTGRHFLLKWSSRSKGSCEQDRAEQEDDDCAANGAARPHRVRPSAARPAKFEREDFVLIGWFAATLGMDNTINCQASFPA